MLNLIFFSKKKLLPAILTILLTNIALSADDFKALNDIQDQYNRREQNRNYIMTGMKTATALGAIAASGVAEAGSLGILSPLTIPLTVWGVSQGVDALDTLTKIGTSKDINEQYNAFIYNVYKNDSAIFAKIVAEPDEVKRTQQLFDKISELDSYKDLIPTDAMAKMAYNSAAIVKIIEVTKGLSLENIDQNVAIKKLEEDFLSLGKKIIDPAIKNKVISFNKAITNASNLFNKVTETANRTIASIDEAQTQDVINPEAPEEITPKVQSFKEKYTDFHSTLTQAATYYQAAYEISVSLGLHGKDQEHMQKGMTYLTTAISISKVIMSPGDPQSYMTAAISLTGLFGKKREPVDPKQQEIMNAFGKMFELQERMLKNQEEIYKLQMKNYELLVSLYEFNEKAFIKVNDGLDLILGGQAVLQKEVKDYAAISPKLESCDSFLNSRVNCPPSDFEDTTTIPRCLKRNLKTDFEIPTNFIYYTGIYGQYKNLQSLENHLKDNLDSYQSCQDGMDDLFPSTTAPIHSTFLTANIVAGNTTGYQTVVAKSYLPLINIAKKVYSNENDFYLLYIMLLNPSPGLNQYSSRQAHARSWLTKNNDGKILSQNQVQNALENLINVPNLEKYASIQLQLLNYTQYISPDFNSSSTVNPNFLTIGLNNVNNKKIANRLFILEKLVNIAIAQQTLLAGQPFIDKVDPFLQANFEKTPEQDAVLQLLKNNSFFSLNYFKQSLRNLLTYNVNLSQSLKPQAKLEANLKLYGDYLNSGYSKCGTTCDDPIFLSISKKYNLTGKIMHFKDSSRGDFSIELPGLSALSNDHFEHTAELKRLFSLRALIESYIYKSATFIDLAINQNYYAL